MSWLAATRRLEEDMTRVLDQESRRMVLTEMQEEVEENNIAKGWYEGVSARTVGEDCALLHSEVSEALEAYRERGLSAWGTHEDGMECAPPCDAAKPHGFGSEMADIFIRLLDTCNRRGIDLYAEYERKMAFNRTRPHRHGGKAL